MNSFADLGISHNEGGSSEIDEKLAHDFVLYLVDNMFGQHSHVEIDMTSESEKNHELIKKSWKMIRQLYNVRQNTLRSQKLVRQTMIQIVENLNEQYQFKQPITLDHKRIDSYDRNKDGKKKYTRHWIEIKF